MKISICRNKCALDFIGSFHQFSMQCISASIPRLSNCSIRSRFNLILFLVCSGGNSISDSAQKQSESHSELLFRVTVSQEQHVASEEAARPGSRCRLEYSASTAATAATTPTATPTDAVVIIIIIFAHTRTGATTASTSTASSLQRCTPTASIVQDDDDKTVATA
jgi:hypothetical protein